MPVDLHNLSLNDDLLKSAKNLQANKEFTKAIQILKKILKTEPNNPEVLFHLGSSYIQSNYTEVGIEYLIKSVEIYPKSIGVLNNLGIALIDVKRFSEAERFLRLALKLDPDNILVNSTLGSLYSKKNDLNTAILYYENAIRIDSNYHRAYLNLGILYSSKGSYIKAIKHYEFAISLKDNYFQAKWNLSLLLLLTGNFIQGWKFYESRIFYQETKKVHDQFIPEKKWRGHDIKGKNLLIYGEQGFGDMIQFIRFIPLLEKFKANVILYMPEELINLFSTIKTNFLLVSKKFPIPSHDFHCPLMSLPGVFKTDLLTIPKEIPYLFPDRKIHEVERLFKENNRLKVGVVFSGSNTNTNDFNRSIELRIFKDIFIKDIDFYSLQKDYKKEDLLELKKINDILVCDFEFNDFSDTATIIQKMDLIITVDTAIAHLAGALGKKVWILLPYAPDFRWLLNTRSTQWYPSARLFRQSKRMNWSNVIIEVKERLLKLRQELS